jgi:hypothetical protein
MAALLTMTVLVAPAAAQRAPATQTVRGCAEIDQAPGLVWKGTERRMTLQQFAAYAAPVFWLSPDEPTAKKQRGRDIRVPAALPFEAQPESPVVYYQFKRLVELPDASGPGFIADPSDPARAVLDLRNLSAVDLDYLAYFPSESGVGQHPHDVEPTEFRLLVGRSNGELARQLGYTCDEEFYVVVITRVTGEAHGNPWYYNVLDVDQETVLPVRVLVEEGKHGMATDRNADGYFTPGYDVSVRTNDAWGVRDTIRGGTLFTSKFEAWMAKVRRPEHQVLPPLPADSALRAPLFESRGDPSADAIYDLRPFPSSALAADDSLLQHKMREKEVTAWPVVRRPDALAAPLEEWFAEGLELKPYSLSYRFDGAAGLSLAFPLFLVKNFNEPLSGGYIVHRVYARGKNLGDWGWMAMYTPSASRWFDQYIAAGVEDNRYQREDGTPARKVEFVMETGVKFRFRAPNRAFSWMTEFWGFRAGIKSVGAFDIDHLMYVIEIGAGVW